MSSGQNRCGANGVVGMRQDGKAPTAPRCHVLGVHNYVVSLHIAMYFKTCPALGTMRMARDAQVFETSPFFSFHHCNACEHGKYVTVDTVAWDELSFTGFNVDSLSAAYYRCLVRTASLLAILFASPGQSAPLLIRARHCERGSDGCCNLCMVASADYSVAAGCNAFTTVGDVLYHPKAKQ